MKLFISILFLFSLIFFESTHIKAEEKSKDVSFLKASGQLPETVSSLKFSAVAYSAEGKLYLINQLQPTVLVLDKKMNFVGEFFTGLENPTSIAVDSGERIIVADATGNMVSIIGSTGQIVTKFKTWRPYSVATLSDGKIVITSPRKSGLIHLYDRKGTKLKSFGDAAILADTIQQSRFLNRGKVAADSADNIFYVSEFTVNPNIKKFSSDGKLLMQAPIEGDTVNVQRVFGKQLALNAKQDELTGAVLVNTISVDRVTGHLWIGMNGSSKYGSVYQYDSQGNKLSEIALTTRVSTGKAIVSASVKALSVQNNSLFASTEFGTNNYVPTNTLSNKDINIDQCGIPQIWDDCTVTCRSGTSTDTISCKSRLAGSLNISDKVIVAKSCSSGGSRADCSVTLCDKTTGDRTQHSASVECPPPILRDPSEEDEEGQQS